VDALEHPEHAVHIAMVGKYVDLTESYKSLSEALIHAGIHTRSKVHIHYVDSEAIERDASIAWPAWTAFLVPGGFGKRGVEGKIRAIRFARENHVPYLGSASACSSLSSNARGTWRTCPTRTAPS